MLAGTALSATQKAAITVSNVVYQTPGDNTTPVVAYTITFKGDYSAAGYNMRLGDLQRSAINILNVVKQTQQFQQLASLKGVSGISVGSYTGQFSDLKSFVSVTKARVLTPPTGTAPVAGLSATTAVPASGWYRGPVTVQASTDDPDNTQLLVKVDDGELAAYTAPVVVTGDGVHTVDLVALGENGMVTLKSLTVKIDGTPPTATVTSAVNGKLALSASDAGSGVKAIQYSVDGGAHWSTYSGVATIAGAPKSVQYRATDVAGNVSATKSVTVTGAKLVLSTPLIKGTVVTGHTVISSIASYTSGATLEYQWYRSGKAIAGATKWNYPIVAADKGTSLSVHVTERKTGYSPVTAVSASVLVH
jgi:beta-glucosidase